MKYQNIFIVGGAGFLGYHASLELTNRGVAVSALALPDEVVDESLSSRVEIARADIDALNDEQLAELLTGYDALVYAAGPDDRVELKSGVKASEFFQTQLVERTVRVLRIAKEQGVKKAIIFGSYFSYINNHGVCGVKKGSLERHPYIKARVEQTKRAFALGDDNFSVAVLNIPYVFGTAPGKEPIWKKIFIERYKDQPKIIYGSGGSTAISAKKIAFLTAQALEYAKNSDELPIGSSDMKYQDMISQLLRSARIDKPVANIPSWLQGLFMKLAWRKMQKEQLDSGLDLRYLTQDILARDLFIDHQATDECLRATNYQDDLETIICETGEAIAGQ